MSGLGNAGVHYPTPSRLSLHRILQAAAPCQRAPDFWNYVRNSFIPADRGKLCPKGSGWPVIFGSPLSGSGVKYDQHFPSKPPIHTIKDLFRPHPLFITSSFTGLSHQLSVFFSISVNNLR